MVITSDFVAESCVGGLALVFVSTTFTVKEKDPAVLAFPEITPVNGFRWRPLGSDPLTTDHL